VLVDVVELVGPSLVDVVELVGPSLVDVEVDVELQCSGHRWQ
jgi:hypothetical protein